jgi:GDSL-like lipase/acylhydrolase family protein
VGAAVVTYYQDNAAQIAYNQTGGAHWVHTASTLADAGSAYSTCQTAGDTATYTIQAGDTAIYGVFYVNQPNTPTNEPAVTVSVNGVQTTDPIYLSWDAPTLFQQVHRVIIPLVRPAQMGAAGQTVVITTVNPSAGNSVNLNGLLVIGAKGSPLGGVFTPLGDSWTSGSGVQQPSGMSWATLLGAELTLALKRRVQLTNFGLTGDFLVGVSSSLAGGTWRCIADINGVQANGLFAAQPEFITILFGPNDLGGGSSSWSAGQHARNLTHLLCLIEDALDVTASGIYGKVVVGTPGYRGQEMDMPRNVLGGNRIWSQALDNYEQAVWLTRQVVAQFPWARPANIWKVMDLREDLVYPNANSDLGNHPNGLGHRIIMQEFKRAFLGL